MLIILFRWYERNSHIAEITATLIDNTQTKIIKSAINKCSIRSYFCSIGMGGVFRESQAVCSITPSIMYNARNRDTRQYQGTH